MGNNEKRWIGTGGLTFVALLVIVTAVVSTPPDINANAAKLVSYYTKSRQTNFGLAGFMTVATVVLGGFWFWYFRELIAAPTAVARRLATVAFTGAVIFAAGGGLSAGLDFVLSDAAGKASPGAIEVLNYLDQELVLGLMAAGVVLFLLATALVVIRTRSLLPAWLGWLAAVFAAAAFAITPLAVPFLALWMIPTNIVLIARSRAESSAVAATSA